MHLSSFQCVSRGCDKQFNLQNLSLGLRISLATWPADNPPRSFFRRTMASSLPNQSTTAAPSAATMAMGNYQAQASSTRSTNATNHAMLMQMARQHLQAQQVTLPNSNIPQVWEQRQVFDPITRLTSTCWQNTSTSDISRNPIIANATSTRYSGIVSVLPSSHNHFVGGLPDGYVLAIIQDPRRDHRQQQPRAHPSPIATHLTEQNTLPAAATPATTNRNQLAATLLQQQQQTLAMPNPGTTATTYSASDDYGNPCSYQRATIDCVFAVRISLD